MASGHADIDNLLPTMIRPTNNNDCSKNNTQNKIKIENSKTNKRRKIIVPQQEKNNEPKFGCHIPSNNHGTNHIPVNYAKEEQLAVETVRLVKKLNQLDKEYEAFSFTETSFKDLFKKIQQEKNQLQTALRHYRNEAIYHSINTTKNHSHRDSTTIEVNATCDHQCSH